MIQIPYSREQKHVSISDTSGGEDFNHIVAESDHTYHQKNWWQYIARPLMCLQSVLVKKCLIRIYIHFFLEPFFLSKVKQNSVKPATILCLHRILYHAFYQFPIISQQNQIIILPKIIGSNTQRGHCHDCSPCQGVSTQEGSHQNVPFLFRVLISVKSHAEFSEACDILAFTQKIVSRFLFASVAENFSGGKHQKEEKHNFEQFGL